MSADVIEFNKKGWGTCKAICLSCQHEWVAVAPIPITEIECPNCKTMKGRMLGEFLPDEFYRCGCGSNLFYITRSGKFCPNCGERDGV